jgi:hypothetical protein
VSNLAAEFHPLHRRRKHLSLWVGYEITCQAWQTGVSTGDEDRIADGRKSKDCQSMPTPAPSGPEFVSVSQTAQALGVSGETSASRIESWAGRGASGIVTARMPQPCVRLPSTCRRLPMMRQERSGLFSRRSKMRKPRLLARCWRRGLRTTLGWTELRISPRAVKSRHRSRMEA